MFKTFATPLAYFGAVARSRSVRRAAETLRVAPSALSRQIRLIEDRAGLALFERLPRGVNLTPAGEILFAYVQRWERDFVGLNDDLHGLAGVRAGTLTLAAVEIATYVIAPRAIRALREQMPGINVHIKTGDTGAVLQELAEGKADIGIVIHLPKTAGIKSAWSVRAAMGVVMPPNHPLAGSPELLLADCLTYPVVMPDESLVARSAIRRPLERTRREVRIAATSDRTASMKALVKAGVGLTFLTQLDVSPELASGELCFVKLKDRDIEAPRISLIIAKHSKPSLAQLQLLELLKRELDLNGIARSEKVGNQSRRGGQRIQLDHPTKSSRQR